ncbi:MAG: CHAT domain-containing protein, partial [Bacteroidota bacterium]|nr:CHAT domain-containing protein [Bacteroidota bacterium]
CETGLGEFHNGEGIYGLQAALGSAGARSVIMSLWKVDDIATQSLMTSFYKYWIKHPDNMRLAFQQAEQDLRAEFPEPYFWGAFVLSGN